MDDKYVADLEAERDKLRAALVDVERERDHLRTDLQAHRDAVRSLRGRLTEMTAERDRLLEQLAGARNKES